MATAIELARRRCFQNGNLCRAMFSTTGFRIRARTPNSGITHRSGISNEQNNLGHKEFAPNTVPRSRAPALERTARKLLPPYLQVEAGASSAVCSEAGASEQEQSSCRITREARCGPFRSRSERRLFDARSLTSSA